MRVWGGCGVDKFILGVDMGNKWVWPFLVNDIARRSGGGRQRGGEGGSGGGGGEVDDTIRE
jgi:hypothetical protein